MLVKSNKYYDFEGNITKISLKILKSCFEKMLEGRIEPFRGPHEARRPRV
jgi:hypothetical protein